MELFRIGKVSGTHHLKGTVKVTSSFDELDILPGNKVIIEFKNGQKKVLTIKDARRINGKIVLMDFEEIQNKTDALTLSGVEINIRRDLLGEINEDEYYLSDIIGMEVYNNGKLLGQVEDVFETAAHDIYVVGEGKEEIMIPAVEEFVLGIDFEGRRIDTDLPEDLINLNK